MMQKATRSEKFTLQAKDKQLSRWRSQTIQSKTQDVYMNSKVRFINKTPKFQIVVNTPVKGKKTS